MGQSEADVLVNVAQSTHSDLIRFFVIAAVVFIVTLIPIYITMAKDRKDRLRLEHKRLEQQEEHENKRHTRQEEHENKRIAQYIEREKSVIEVIKANTSVATDLRSAISDLKTTLEVDRSTFTSSLSRIHASFISLKYPRKSSCSCRVP